ncbi:MAG: hypothetical protein IPH54_23580 [Rhodoferax sp.]|nr:hypothetical protein [Rhodoferax sp.]
MARFTIEDEIPASSSGFTIDDAPEARPALTPEQIARASGADLPSPVQGFVTAMQGPLFSSLDEMTGAVQGAKSMLTGGDYLPAYREGRDLIRGMEEQYRKDYPITATVAPLMASAPVFVGGPQLVLKAPAGASGAGVLARQMAGAGGTAAGYGAITSAGESENQDGNLLSDVLTGGLSSAATAGASVPVVNILSGVVGRTGRMLPPKAAERVAAAVPDALKPAGMSRDDYATRKVAEQLIRDQPTTASVKDPLARALAYLRWMGRDARLVDVGGTQTRREFDVLATLPGRTPEAAAQAVMQRQAGRGAAIMREADKALGTRGAQFQQTVDDLVKSRESAAKPLYQRLRAMTVTVDDDLSSIINASRDLGALGEARTMATALRQRFTLEDVPTASGMPVGMADLDMVKRGLDQLVRKETDAVTGKVSPKGMAYQSLLVDLRNKLDDMTIDPQTGQSVYKAARDAFAGPSKLRDAAEIGRNAFAPDKNFAIREAIADMSESEIMAMRVGLMQAIREKAGDQSGQTWLMNNWKNPSTREKIQLAFGKDAGRFISSLAKQAKLKLMEGSVGGGSQTATRLANADDLGIEAIKEAAAGAASAKAGDVPGAMSWLQKLVKQTDLPEPIRNEMGRILLLKGDAARAKLMEMSGLLDLIARQQAKQASAAGAFVGRQNPWLTGGNATNGDQ